jgi:hypothetical protein
MKFFLVLTTVLFSQSVLAQSLSPNALPAGKSIVGKILDSSNNDITSQYTLSYSGTELKITEFAGKSVLVGSIVGNWAVTATKISDSSEIQIPVTVTAGAVASITLVSGSGQTAVAGENYANLIEFKSVDSFGNAVAATPVTFSVTTGSAKFSGQSSSTVNSDSNGLVSVQATAGSVAESEVISASIIISGVAKSVTLYETTTTPPHQAARIVISSQSPSAHVGQTASLSLEAEDSTGAQAPAYGGSVSIAGYKNSGCTTASTIAPTGTLSATAASGLVNFSNIQPQVVEPLYLKISAAGLPAICSQAISVSAPITGLTSLKITQLPTLLNTNQNLFPAVKVAELDNNSQVLASAADAISITSYDDSSCSQQSSTQLLNNSGSAIGGYATFSKLQASAAKTIYLKASSGSTVSACSAALSIMVAANATPTPVPAPALVFTPSVTNIGPNSGSAYVGQISGGTPPYAVIVGSQDYSKGTAIENGVGVLNANGPFVYIQGNSNAAPNAESATETFTVKDSHNVTTTFSLTFAPGIYIQNLLPSVVGDGTTQQIGTIGGGSGNYVVGGGTTGTSFYLDSNNDIEMMTSESSMGMASSFSFSVSDTVTGAIALFNIQETPAYVQLSFSGDSTVDSDPNNMLYVGSFSGGSAPFTVTNPDNIPTTLYTDYSQGYPITQVYIGYWANLYLSTDQEWFTFSDSTGANDSFQITFISPMEQACNNAGATWSFNYPAGSCSCSDPNAVFQYDSGTMSGTCFTGNLQEQACLATPNAEGWNPGSGNDGTCFCQNGLSYLSDSTSPTGYSCESQEQQSCSNSPGAYWDGAMCTCQDSSLSYLQDPNSFSGYSCQ